MQQETRRSTPAQKGNTDAPRALLWASDGPQGPLQGLSRHPKRPEQVLPASPDGRAGVLAALRDFMAGRCKAGCETPAAGRNRRAGDSLSRGRAVKRPAIRRCEAATGHLVTDAPDGASLVLRQGAKGPFGGCPSAGGGRGPGRGPGAVVLLAVSGRPRGSVGALVGALAGRHMLPP